MAFGEKIKQISFPTVISKETEIIGDLKLKDNLWVEGKISGCVESQQMIHIAQQATINGDIKASDMFVAGQIKGNISITGTLELDRESMIEGDIFARNIKIHLGAVINGHLEMKQEKQKLQNESQIQDPDESSGHS